MLVCGFGRVIAVITGKATGHVSELCPYGWTNNDFVDKGGVVPYYPSTTRCPRLLSFTFKLYLRWGGVVLRCGEIQAQGFESLVTWLHSSVNLCFLVTSIMYRECVLFRMECPQTMGTSSHLSDAIGKSPIATG